MLRAISPKVLLSVLGLSLAASTIACSGADAKNDDVDTSKLAVQSQKDGKPTGDGKTCSWGSVRPVTPVPVVGATPPSGGSSGGCDSNGNCWSYDANGNEKPIERGSSSGWSSSSSSGGSSSGGSSSGGSSGGCTTDEKGDTKCWSSPPQPEPPVAPIPEPTPQTFQLGEWFPALDGCNRCTCTGVGIMCTIEVCAAPVPEEPPPPSKGCEVDGKWFAAGDRVPGDSCNSCSCGPDGYVACTMMACEEPAPPSPTPPSPPKPVPGQK